MTPPERVLVTGGSGTIAKALRKFRPSWIYRSHAECDVRDANSVYENIEAFQPEVVLHTAALTDHQHPNAAEVIETNICGTEHVARVCAVSRVPMVYLSTHYVYAGTAGNYDERSVPRPIGSYAWSKLVGERWTRTLLPHDSLVIRGSWYTRETRLDRWAERGALTDAWCSRESASDAARKIVALVEAKARDIVNIGGARRTFAEILRDEGYAEFIGVKREHFDAPYPFPADTSVNTDKFRALGLALP